MTTNNFVSKLILGSYLALVPGVAYAQELPGGCPPGQTEQCVSTAPKKKAGPSKAIRDLRTSVGALSEKDKQLEGVLTTYGRALETLQNDLQSRLQGYEALKQQVDTLAQNQGLSYLSGVVGDLFKNLTVSKDALNVSCTASANAYGTFAAGEKKYHSDRQSLLDKMETAAGNASNTPPQRAAEAARLKNQLDTLDAAHRTGKDSLDRLKALCDRRGREYDTQEKAVKAKTAELKAVISSNLSRRPDQFTLRLQQGWLRNEEANQGYTSAEAAYHTRRGWSFSVEGGQLYGEATTDFSVRSVDEGQSPVGDNLRERSWTDETTATSMKYNNFVQFGLDKAWKVGKTRKTGLQLGVSTGAYTGTETKTVDSTKVSQLSANDGTLIGDAHGVNEVTTTNRTLYDFVVGASAELQRKFWGNLNLTLGGSVLYDTELNRTLPRFYLGVGANW
jgi:hypothetical protein